LLIGSFRPERPVEDVDAGGIAVVMPTIFSRLVRSRLPPEGGGPATDKGWRVFCELANYDAVVMMVMVVMVVASRHHDDSAVSMGRMVMMMMVVGLG